MQSVALAILTVIDAKWDVADGGVRVSYAVGGADLPVDTSIALYWATGPDYADRIAPDNIQFSITAQKPVGTYDSVPVDQAVFQGVGQPPANAADLLIVPDAAGLLMTTDVKADAFALPYDPRIDVSAKYNGSQNPLKIGRFFAMPGLVTDESFTLTLSDSLAAIRPSPLVRIGDVKLPADPDTGLLGSWDGKTYVTGTFDPGTLPGPTEINAQALGSPDVLAEQDLTLDIVPVPRWIQDLQQLKPIRFDADLLDSNGTYTFSGVLGTLVSSNLAIPSSWPYIGGDHVGADVAYGLTIVTTLDPAVSPQFSGFASIQLNLLDKAHPSFSFSTSPASVGAIKLKVQLGAPLDPRTLDVQGGFSLTVGLSGPLDQVKAPFFESQVFELPFALQFGLYEIASTTVDSQLSVSMDGDGNLVVDPSSTYVQLGADYAIQGDVKAGLFAPTPEYLSRFMALPSGSSRIYWPSSIRQTPLSGSTLTRQSPVI